MGRIGYGDRFANGRTEAKFFNDKKEGTWPDFSELSEEMARLSSLRHSQLSPDRKSRVQSNDGGRLLLYRPHECKYAGASENVSHGFFDKEDVPPWDTWVAVLRDTPAPFDPGDVILAWVPEEYISLADYGIAANVSALDWADEKLLKPAT